MRPMQRICWRQQQKPAPRSSLHNCFFDYASAARETGFEMRPAAVAPARDNLLHREIANNAELRQEIVRDRATILSCVIRASCACWLRECIACLSAVAGGAVWPLSEGLLSPDHRITASQIAVVQESELVRHVDERAVSTGRSEEHTSELQSRLHLVCRLLLEKKKTTLDEARTQYHNSISGFGSEP